MIDECLVEPAALTASGAVRRGSS